MDNEIQPDSTVGFIAGSGRSGSTLLAMMLGANSEAFAVGEIDIFIEKILSGESCTCMKSIPECPVWGQVLGQGEDAATEKVPATLNSRDKMTKIWGLITAIIGGRPANTKISEVQKAWSLLDEVGLQTNRRVIIDASKGLLRVAKLATVHPQRIKVIHLFRDVRGFVTSSSTPRMVSAPDGREGKTRVLSKVEATANWLIHNILVYLYGWICLKDRYFLLSYEGLISEPERNLKALCAFCGLNYQKQMLPPLDFKEFHLLGGNHSRFGGYDSLKLDEKWKRKLSFREKLLISVAAGWFHSFLLRRAKKELIRGGVYEPDSQ
jgi:hypothetical protein